MKSRLKELFKTVLQTVLDPFHSKAYLRLKLQESISQAEKDRADYAKKLIELRGDYDVDSKRLRDIRDGHKVALSQLMAKYDQSRRDCDYWYNWASQFIDVRPATMEMKPSEFDTWQLSVPAECIIADLTL